MTTLILRAAFLLLLITVAALYIGETTFGGSPFIKVKYPTAAIAMFVMIIIGGIILYFLKK